jgi:hypothetical protein
MCVYTCIHVYALKCIYMYIYIHVYIQYLLCQGERSLDNHRRQLLKLPSDRYIMLVHLYVCTCLYVNNIYAYVCIHIYEYIYTCIYIYMNIYKYVYIYIYVYIHNAYSPSCNNIMLSRSVERGIPLLCILS